MTPKQLSSPATESARALELVDYIEQATTPTYMDDVLLGRGDREVIIAALRRHAQSPHAESGVPYEDPRGEPEMATALREEDYAPCETHWDTSALNIVNQIWAIPSDWHPTRRKAHAQLLIGIALKAAAATGR